MIHAQALSIGESVHQNSALIALSLTGTDIGIKDLPTGLSLSEEEDWSDEDIDSNEDFDEDDYVFEDDEDSEDSEGEDKTDDDEDWDEEDSDR